MEKISKEKEELRQLSNKNMISVEKTFGTTVSPKFGNSIFSVPTSSSSISGFNCPNLLMKKRTNTGNTTFNMNNIAGNSHPTNNPLSTNNFFNANFFSSG